MGGAKRFLILIAAVCLFVLLVQQTDAQQWTPPPPLNDPNAPIICGPYDHREVRNGIEVCVRDANSVVPSAGGVGGESSGYAAARDALGAAQSALQPFANAALQQQSAMAAQQFEQQRARERDRTAEAAQRRQADDRVRQNTTNVFEASGSERDDNPFGASCDCGLQNRRGACQASIALRGNQIEVTSNAPQCSMVVWYADEQPKFTIVTGGFSSEQWLGPSTPQFNVDSCQVCGD